MTGPATENQAVIFDVQSFSIHDGPGIRTTVFFKGCPLNCMWCHNPESKKTKQEILFRGNLCGGCLLCVNTCPSGAQTVLADGSRAMNHRACTACGKCLEVCCYDALAASGKNYSPAALLEKTSGDTRYFAIAGNGEGGRGGITFSGGEPLLYADFIRAFHQLAPDIHITVETSGYGSTEAIEKILDCAALFLFDIKVINQAEHKKYCGVDNAVIFRNLEFIYEKGKKIVLRLPLIPGINDTQEQFEGIAEILRKHPKIERAEIMPYHNLGIAKAESLGLEIPAELPRANAGTETINGWLGRFRALGCDNIRCA